MRHYRTCSPPRSLRGATVHLDNLALLPASLLPFKAKWQAIANGLPCGEMLIILPYRSKQQRVVWSVARQLREKGKRVMIVDGELRGNAADQAVASAFGLSLKNAL